MEIDYKLFLEQYQYIEQKAEEFIALLKNNELHSSLFHYNDIDIYDKCITIETEDNWRGGTEHEYVDLPFEKIDDLDSYVEELVEDKRKKEEEAARIKEENKHKEQQLAEQREREQYLRLKKKYE